jgi:hypothetical protein
MSGNVVSRFDEEILALNYIRNQAPDYRHSEFAVEKVERVFDSLANSNDRKRLIKFRSAIGGNAVHAGIRNSDLDIGREDLD